MQAQAYGYLADAVVVVHAAYVGFVVVGEAAILAGGLRGWAWVRNFWFRALHLALIGVVVLEVLVGITCPLTDLEGWLRAAAGQEVEQGTFVGRLVHGLLFWDAPAWAFAAGYCAFGALVLATLYWVPIRRTREKATAKNLENVG